MSSHELVMLNLRISCDTFWNHLATMVHDRAERVGSQWGAVVVMYGLQVAVEEKTIDRCNRLDSFRIEKFDDTVLLNLIN